MLSWLRVYLVSVSKNCFLFLRTKTLKTYLVKGVFFVFGVSCVLKMPLFREKNNNVLVVFLIA